MFRSPLRLTDNYAKNACRRSHSSAMMDNRNWQPNERNRAFDCIELLPIDCFYYDLLPQLSIVDVMVSQSTRNGPNGMMAEWRLRQGNRFDAREIHTQREGEREGGEGRGGGGRGTRRRKELVDVGTDSWRSATIGYYLSIGEYWPNPSFSCYWDLKNDDGDADNNNNRGNVNLDEEKTVLGDAPPPFRTKNTEDRSGPAQTVSGGK